MNFYKSIYFSLIIGALVLLPVIVFAQTNASSTGINLQIPLPFVDTNCDLLDTQGNPIKENGIPVKGVCDLSDYLKGVYKLLIGLGALFAVIMIIIAGYQWIFSGGSPDKTGAAKKRIFSAVIGLILSLLAFVILNAITPRLVALRLPEVTPIQPFYSIGNNLCNSTDLRRQVLRPAPATTDLDKDVNIRASKELKAYNVKDENLQNNSKYISINKAACASDYVIVDNKLNSVGQCQGHWCETIDADGNFVGDQSCIDKRCQSIYLRGNISWPSFSNRYVDDIWVIPICNGVDESSIDHRDTANFRGNRVAYQFTRKNLPIISGIAKSRTTVETNYEKAASRCGSNFQGFVLEIEVNDGRGFLPTIDDTYAVGKSGCANNNGGESFPFRDYDEEDLEDQYPFGDIDFSHTNLFPNLDPDDPANIVNPNVDFFSVEDFKQGIQCDIIIDNFNFPPLE